MAEERVKATLQLEEHPEFPVTNEQAIMNSRDICKHVNSIFSRVFADYLGSFVMVDQNFSKVGYSNHPVQIELYFEVGAVSPNSDKKLVAFNPIEAVTAKPNIDPANGKRMNYVQLTSNHNYILTHNKSSIITQDAIDIFTPLLQVEMARSISANPKAAELEQKGVVVEAFQMDQYSVATGNPRKVIYNIIRFLDIDSILHALFTKPEDEGVVYYQTLPIKPIVPAVNGQIYPQNAGVEKWLYQVSRLNKNNILTKCNEMGIFQSTNGINMYTETF